MFVVHQSRVLQLFRLVEANVAQNFWKKTGNNLLCECVVIFVFCLVSGSCMFLLLALCCFVLFVWCVFCFCMFVCLFCSCFVLFA
jgi:hypothetical protein